MILAIVALFVGALIVGAGVLIAMLLHLGTAGIILVESAIIVCALCFLVTLFSFGGK